MARIVLNPFGSLGDLHPYLALAHALRGRGHHVTVASSEVYRGKVEGDGFAFAAVCPDVEDLTHRPELMAKLLDARHGTEFLLREYLIPQVRGAFGDLEPVCRNADLLVTHTAGYGGPIAAERLKHRWMSVALQPATMFSRYDLMTLPRAPWLRHFYFLGPALTRLLLKIGDWQTRRWAEPIYRLRRELGLATDLNPVMMGQYSPHGTLALFSRHFAGPQVDWPANTRQPGFLFYDALGKGLPGGDLQARNHERFERFMSESGNAPVVLFTLGSSAVMHPGSFYDESLKAVKRLGIRAIFLAGKWDAADENVLVADYLPYSTVMPRVAAAVHAGGIGSTAQALRAGCRSLVVPWSNDQPDNAHRLQRLGVARVLPRAQYRAGAAVREIQRLLDSSTEASRCLGREITDEPSLAAACDAVEGAL